MKNILFNKITIKNFLSVGNEPVVVEFKPGLHIITGINRDKDDRRNGVGKSTVADAVYFAVFGETLRDLKKEYVINNVNKKTCEIILDVTVVGYNKTKENIQIIRTLDPSKCYVYVNEEDKTRDSIANTNAYIASKFDCTPEIFQNCVIMTINNTIPFMAKKKQEKRKFIEDIFNLSVFSNMLSDVKNDISERKKNFEILAARHDEAGKSLETLKKQSENLKIERELKKKKYTLRQENNTKELEALSKTISLFQEIDIQKNETDIKLLVKKSEKLDATIKELRDKVSSAKTQIDIKEKDLKKIGTEKDVCPTCLRPIEEHDRNHIKQEKTKIKKEIDAFNEDIKENHKKEEETAELENKVYAAIESLKIKINDFKIKQKEIENIKSRINQLNTWQKELEIDLKDLENSNNTSDLSLQEHEVKIDKISEEIESIKTDLNKLDVVKFVMSEEGVKSYIVKKILQIFNTKLAYYLKKMDANCVCKFNEYFEEDIIDDKGKECSYFNFSGAERKNIDLACLFTFMDIRRLQGDISFNFSIYDELFDSSLDEKGVELVISILKERVEKYKECAMVISHRKESIKAATGDIIFLEKVNGITKRVNFLEYQGE
jgi:DNA repair exonuclease SbcCD ATPase subunit